jgi:two-component system sensor histidine kinase YesM
MKRSFISLRKKMQLMILPLIVIPLLISITITYHVFMKSQEEQSRSFMENTLAQVTSNLDRYTKELGSLSLMPILSEELLNILRARASAEHATFIKTEEKLVLSRFMVSLMIERDEIMGYMLFSNDGMLFSTSNKEVSTQWQLKDEKTWMSIALQGDGRLVYLPPNYPRYYTNMKESVVSVARRIIDPITFDEVGYVKIDLTQEGFRKILYPVGEEKTLFFVYNKNGQRIYPQDMQEAFILKGNKLEYKGNNYLVSSKTSDYSGISVYVLYPYNELQKNANQIIRVMLTISITSLILSILSSIYFAKRITKPIRILKEVMQRLSAGDFSVRSLIEERDEIGELSIGFNSMAEKIQILIKEQFQLEIKEKEAEILVLQSQMNPHFFYNTLETISMVAMNNDDLETSDLVSKLGKMMRYTISTQSGHVYLETEIQFVEDYLDLQVKRLGGKLKFHIDLDSELESCLVPKLILQPFIENIIIHAIKDKPVNVKIIATVQWEDLILAIKDDGVGMSQERQNEIQKIMYDKTVGQENDKNYEITSGGIALRNVHQRIQMIFGVPYGVTISSKENKGTTFILRLPLTWDNTEGGYEDV